MTPEMIDDWITDMIQTREEIARDEWLEKTALEFHAEGLETKLRSFKRGTLLLMTVLSIETVAIGYLSFLCYWSK